MEGRLAFPARRSRGLTQARADDVVGDRLFHEAGAAGRSKWRRGERRPAHRTPRRRNIAIVPPNRTTITATTIQNNEIRNAGYGIAINGLSTAANTGLVITGNQVGPLFGDNTYRIGNEGIRLVNATSAQIVGNEVTGLYNSTAGVAGIDLVSNAAGATLSANKIHDIEAYGATT